MYNIFKNHITYSKSLNITYFWGFNFLAGFMLFNQIFNGLFFIMYYIIGFIIVNFTFYYFFKNNKSEILVIKNILFLLLKKNNYNIFKIFFILMLNFNFAYSMGDADIIPNSSGDKGFVVLIIVAIFYYMYLQIQKNPKDLDLKKNDSKDSYPDKWNPYYDDSDTEITKLIKNIPDIPDSPDIPETVGIVILIGVTIIFITLILCISILLLSRYISCLYYPELEMNKTLITPEILDDFYFFFKWYLAVNFVALMLDICLFQFK